MNNNNDDKSSGWYDILHIIPYHNDLKKKFQYMITNTSQSILPFFGCILSVLGFIGIISSISSPFSLLGGLLYFIIGIIMSLTYSSYLRRIFLNSLSRELISILFEKSVIDILSEKTTLTKGYSLISMLSLLDSEDIKLLTNNLPSECNVFREKGLVNLLPYPIKGIFVGEEEEEEESSNNSGSSNIGDSNAGNSSGNNDNRYGVNNNNNNNHNNSSSNSYSNNTQNDMSNSHYYLHDNEHNNEYSPPSSSSFFAFPASLNFPRNLSRNVPGNVPYSDSGFDDYFNNIPPNNTNNTDITNDSDYDDTTTPSATTINSTNNDNNDRNNRNNNGNNTLLSYFPSVASHSFHSNNNYHNNDNNHRNIYNSSNSSSINTDNHRHINSGHRNNPTLFPVFRNNNMHSNNNNNNTNSSLIIASNNNNHITNSINNNTSVTLQNEINFDNTLQHILNKKSKISSDWIKKKIYDNIISYTYHITSGGDMSNLTMVSLFSLGMVGMNMINMNKNNVVNIMGNSMGNIENSSMNMNYTVENSMGNTVRNVILNMTNNRNYSHNDKLGKIINKIINNVNMLLKNNSTLINTVTITMGCTLFVRTANAVRTCTCHTSSTRGILECCEKYVPYNLIPNMKMLLDKMQNEIENKLKNINNIYNSYNINQSYIVMKCFNIVQFIYGKICKNNILVLVIITGYTLTSMLAYKLKINSKKIKWILKAIISYLVNIVEKYES